MINLTRAQKAVKVGHAVVYRFWTGDTFEAKVLDASGAFLTVPDPDHAHLLRVIHRSSVVDHGAHV